MVCPSSGIKGLVRPVQFKRRDLVIGQSSTTSCKTDFHSRFKYAAANHSRFSCNPHASSKSLDCAHTAQLTLLSLLLAYSKSPAPASSLTNSFASFASPSQSLVCCCRGTCTMAGTLSLPNQPSPTGRVRQPVAPQRAPVCMSPAHSRAGKSKSRRLVVQSAAAVEAPAAPSAPATGQGLSEAPLPDS